MNILPWLTFFLWFIALVIVVAPIVQRRLLTLRRVGVLERFGRARGSRALALIARRETYSLLGFPLLTRNVIEPSANLLRAIARTPSRTPIDLILHIGPDDPIAAEQIAHALVRHAGKVTVFVPYSALGSGLLIALASENLVTDPNAVLGPVSPRVGRYPAVALLRAAQQRGAENLTDEYLTLVDPAQQATAQVRRLIRELLVARSPEHEAIDDVVDQLAGISWTPAYPILMEEAVRLGLAIDEQLPPEVHTLLELYDTSTTRYASTAVVHLD